MIRHLSAMFLAALITAVLFAAPLSLAHADPMDHGDHAALTGTAAAEPSTGQVLFDRIKALAGTWEAPTRDGTMVDIFKPFAFDTAVLGEEWLNGKQITSTIFYVVGSELRVDHFCDFKNQPRYTAVPSLDPQIIDMEFRDATNLDTHPAHFHSTKWRIVDADHLIQEWFVLGGKKPVSLAHMEFTKRTDATTASLHD
ncbi:MAG TPA: hypothetical protein VGV37_10295 [Aliidongia sp.]|uniref:hypothetical protein n=1 Tax=Aliidongia sp. TaxID=1914230 RepID=UPI002DDCBCF3|nr:hypothetical protein [Aliidongia sp.]HEV2674920.1 hypothetical protein [Aliidongia sp.]